MNLTLCFMNFDFFMFCSLFLYLFVFKYILTIFVLVPFDGYPGSTPLWKCIHYYAFAGM